MRGCTQLIKNLGDTLLPLLTSLRFVCMLVCYKSESSFPRSAASEWVEKLFPDIPRFVKRILIAAPLT